ncbi:E3 ubiquitin-protein ligase PRT1 [Acorus gramineus]|uniref:E3 ubiquitin-protein ligase PRT1 n=1 Tax=Acorus gramineus TaxID=55184 RepID=A0AAV9APV1_ACOGR|nr:E3 ubiquitin-protein ligase PRT1 [Acorus gramineus]
MLFRPAVLNCGHIYCEDCMYSLANGTLRCQVCKSCHPGGFPKVCLDLDHFLEKHFPEEYAQRKDAQNEEDNIRSERVDASLKMNSVTSAYTVHIQVGCDSCGAYPIIGKRHNCKDCVEKIGFDLCGDCYENRSTLPGRFNQQHTPEHIFELIDSTGRVGRYAVQRR